MHRIAISVTPRCFVAAGVIGLAGLGSSANAEVPEYTVEVVATYDFTTTLTGSSDVGHVVGWRVLNGLVVPFLATPGTGITAMPLPDGYLTGAALDVNDDGLVVGTNNLLFSLADRDTGFDEFDDSGNLISLTLQHSHLPDVVD